MGRKNQGLSQRINLKVTPELEAQIKQQQTAEQTFSDVVRSLIEAALSGNSGQPSIDAADHEATQARYQHADNLRTQRNLDLMLRNANAAKDHSAG